MVVLHVHRRRAMELDRTFLEDVHVAALGPIALVGYGWPAERLRQQFHAEIDLANCQVIVVDGKDVGYISVMDREGARGRYWYIDAFAIATRYQKRGIGQAALRDLLEDAGRIPVRLSVLRTNRARSLYRRMGFRVIGGDVQRELLEWRAQP